MIYKRIILIFIIISPALVCQQLPRIDNGMMISYHTSNRHIPQAPKQSAIYYPGIEYKFHVNFKSGFSFKTGTSLFITGHKFSYLFVPDRGYSGSYITHAKSIYGYMRIPFLLSFHIKHFFVDLGLSPCLRVFNNSDSYYQRGNGIDKPGATYALEAHVGYYIPLKQRRMFVESAVYFSEIGNAIFLPGGNYSNIYTQNIQIGIGFMFNKYH